MGSRDASLHFTQSHVKTSKYLSIKVSTLEEVSCSFTDKTIGLAVMVKNTYQVTKT
jgi:hypothetical protein